jgi:hypothetical protein
MTYSFFCEFFIFLYIIIMNIPISHNDKLITIALQSPEHTWNKASFVSVESLVHKIIKDGKWIESTITIGEFRELINLSFQNTEQLGKFIQNKIDNILHEQKST